MGKTPTPRNEQDSIDGIITITFKDISGATRIFRLSEKETIKLSGYLSKWRANRVREEILAQVGEEFELAKSEGWTRHKDGKFTYKDSKFQIWKSSLIDRWYVRETADRGHYFQTLDKAMTYVEAQHDRDNRS